MLYRILPLAAGLLFLAPAPASGQVQWDAPFHMGPGLGDGLAVSLMETEPGDGEGVMVSWRRGQVPGGLGFRAGVADGFRDDLAVFGGVDVSGMLIARDAEFPVDLIWAAGAGGSVGDHGLIAFPIGLFVGRGVVRDGVRFVPYAGPRVDVTAHLGGDAAPGGEDDDLDLAVSVDLGFDLVFSERLAARFGASVGDHQALSIGVVIRQVP